MNNGDMPAMAYERAPTDAERQQYGIGGLNGEAPSVWVKGLTKREHFALEIFKEIIIGNNADDAALGKGAALGAIESANILLRELD